MLTSVVRLIRLCRFCRRGHADAEIEAVFAKYDLDGDRILDEEEQRKMQEDLEGQKVRFLVQFGLNSSTSLLFGVSSYDNAFQYFFTAREIILTLRRADEVLWESEVEMVASIFHTFVFVHVFLRFIRKIKRALSIFCQLFGSIDNHTTVDYE